MDSIPHIPFLLHKWKGITSLRRQNLHSTWQYQILTVPTMNHLHAPPAQQNCTNLSCKHTEPPPRRPKLQMRRGRRPHHRPGTWHVARCTPSRARRSTPGATTTATTSPPSARSRTAHACEGLTQGTNTQSKSICTNNTAKTSIPNLKYRIMSHMT